MKLYEAARQLGTFQALAEMLRDQVRELDSADNDFDRTWARTRLTSLADQYDEAVARIAAEKAA